MSYSLTGGADQSLLSINTDTGVVQPEHRITEFDATMHYHSADDSGITIGDVRLDGLPGEVTVDVVTALALSAEC